MKYLIKNLIIFTSLFIILNFTIYLLDKGHTITYTIKNFNIKEVLDVKEGNYYFEIKDENSSINFQIQKNYKKSEKIIKKLHYKEIDKYKCYLPIFKDNEMLTDVLCIKDNTIYYAHDLNNNKITETFKKYGYNPNQYNDTSNEITVSNTQTLYKENIPENDYIAIESYKGLTLFNSKKSNVELFENDIYKKHISTFSGKYYIVADYNSEYTFKNFYVVNIINGDVITIRSYDDISFDSYILGSVKDEIYLFDKETKIEYKINIKDESVKQIGNKDNIKFYNGTWTTITLNEALNEKKFQYNSNIKGFDKVDKVGNYYYLFKNKNDKYIVYRADKQNTKLKTYLFETTDIYNIIYLNDKIYYQNKNLFNYYGTNGTRKILKDTELEFNDDISLGVYGK